MNRISSIDAFRTRVYTPGSIHSLPDITGKIGRYKVIGKGIPHCGVAYVTYLTRDVVMVAKKPVPMKKVLVRKVR